MKSEFKKKAVVWGRECTFDVIFDTQGETVDSAAQQATYQDFVDHWDAYTEKALKAFKEYCKSNYSEELKQLGEPDFSNIFRIVSPKTLFISEDFDDGDSIINLVCYFRFDDEQHICARFNHGEVIEVGGEFIAI